MSTLLRTGCAQGPNPLRGNTEVPMNETRTDPQFTEYLYRCYVRYMEDGRQAGLRVIRDQESREHFARLFRTMPMELFTERMGHLARKPQQYSEFVSVLRNGFAVQQDLERIQMQPLGLLA